jgi:ATP-dependent Lon protease
LDPEQNSTFQDHYLEVDYDLSPIMFITTANSLHPIPRPLLDRMEVIQLEGYIESEKFAIAKKYLVPKQIEMHGLGNHKVSFTDAAIYEIIRSYTKEAGVRNLERNIATVCRKLAKDIVKEEMITSERAPNKGTNKGKTKKASGKSYSLTPKKVTEYLGALRYRYGKIEGANEIGLTNGLAWTEVGGDLLIIEVSVVPGKGKFTITGQLGEVMKESCAAAMSYVRSRGPLFGLDKEFYANADVHIHVPEGAIPKDGPSAGISITTSIVSAMTKIPVKKTVAMTGEVTLRGRVLAIGGLKEKVLAAHRGGIKTIIAPKENEKDLKDIPKEVLKDLKIILVDHVDQVLVNALDIKNAKDLFKARGEKNSGIRAQYTGHQEQHTH